MNRRDAEDTEKKKKRYSPHWRYLRLLTIPVAIFLVVSFALIAVRFFNNLQQYNHNRRLWDEGNHGEVLFLYMDGEGSGRYFGWHLTPHFASSEDWWSISSSCIYQIFCKITYNDQYHYPEYIEPFLGEWRAKADKFIFCSEEARAQYCELHLPNNP
jgi:hypothetical protein